MSLTRILLRATRSAASLHGARNFTTLFPPPSSFSLLPHFSPTASGVIKGLRCTAAAPRCGMSTSAPHEQEQGSAVDNNGDNVNVDAANRSEEVVDNKGDNLNVDAANRLEEAAAADAKSSEQARQTDSELGLDDLSKEELVKVLFEKEETLQKKDKEFGEWKDKFLRSYAEMESIMERTRRDAENSKKFAVQSFAKSLLDVADNLSRASSVTKESFKKIDQSGDTVGVVPLLNSLLEGVEMTEKQLAEVFRKSGIEKYDPTNEQFDPNRHNAVFQVPDNSKPPDTVAVVLKAGYMLHDRIIRPAEVGVTVAQGSD